MLPSYLSGLRLAGRRVVIVGAGAVTTRRLPPLLAAGAEVVVVAPEATTGIVRRARRGELTWLPREFQSDDLAGAWYAMAATDSAGINAAVAAEAETRRIFCVRADDATDATAWTPATAEVDGVMVGVLAGGHPRRAAHVRDLVVELLTRIARRAA